MPQVSFPFSTPDRVMFSGDWHGDGMAARWVLEKAAKEGAQVVVQLGDFGLWPGPAGRKYLRTVERTVRRTGVNLLWLDGNHEDYDQLDAYAVDPVSGLQEFGEGVFHLPRGSRWEWAGVSFCALGGATSLDRPHRVEHESWWSQEAVTRDQADDVMAEGHADVLLLHDCPVSAPVPRSSHRSPSNWDWWPSWEWHIAWEHRKILDEVAVALSPSRVLHGHYHVRGTSVVEFTPGVSTIVDALGMWQGKGSSCTLLLDADEF